MSEHASRVWHAWHSQVNTDHIMDAACPIGLMLAVSHLPARLLFVCHVNCCRCARLLDCANEQACIGTVRVVSYMMAIRWF
jgi:hypothetical protein